MSRKREHDYSSPSHIIIYPVKISDESSQYKAMNDDFEAHAKKVQARLNGSPTKKRFAVTVPIDIDNPKSTRLFVSEYNTIHVVAHGDGRVVGAKDLSLFSMGAEQLVDWLERADVLKKGIKLKINTCYSAVKGSYDDKMYIDGVAGALKAKGLTEITVVGYPGKVGDSLRHIPVGVVTRVHGLFTRRRIEALRAEGYGYEPELKASTVSVKVRVT